jgi:hypothetical protein
VPHRIAAGRHRLPSGPDSQHVRQTELDIDNRRPHGEESIEDGWIEMCPAAFFEDRETAVQWKRRLVGPATAQRVKHIGNRSDAAPQPLTAIMPVCVRRA